MEDSASRPPHRYRWPWFALAAVILAVVLAVLWMSVAVERTRRSRGFLPSAPIPTTTNSPATTNASLLTGGNAESGKRIFFEKPEANCGKCHSVGGQGGDQGPPLDAIGSQRTRAELLEALLKPNAATTEGYESIVLLLKNGMGCSGILKSEDGSTLTVLTPEDGLVTVLKGDIQIRQKGLSPMPEGLNQLLSQQDLRDLVEFMASLQSTSSSQIPR